ncbi:MAG: 4a-hydroxytetrahydrobiopterin dehydratase [Oceanospirillaceae bacterium]|nr:4a-hydroxytetrahydrobiopterin dehydratase [Oceanospirillaceae bacterium]
MSETFCDLAGKSCKPCEGGIPALTKAQASEMMQQLDADWTLAEDASYIEREFKFKGFAKAVYTTNLACFLADQQGHHPDIKMGWGYCTVRFTTHAVNGLSDNDFICAAKLDAMMKA